MTTHIQHVLAQRQLSVQRVVQRPWWAPVWRGLTVEPTAKHFRAMGKALWLYVYLITHANRKTGMLFRLIPNIAHDMGLPTRTIQYWLTQLRKHDYIITQSNGRGLTITVLKWKPLGTNKARPAT